MSDLVERLTERPYRMLNFDRDTKEAAKRIAELEAACNKVLDLCMDGAAERFNTLNMGQVFKILDAAIRGKAIS